MNTFHKCAYCQLNRVGEVDWRECNGLPGGTFSVCQEHFELIATVYATVRTLPMTLTRS